MCRIITLTLIVIASILGHVEKGQAQDNPHSLFKNYFSVKNSDVKYDNPYDRQIKMYESIKEDGEALFLNYLNGTLPEEKIIQKELKKDQILNENFRTASSQGIINGTLKLIKSMMPASNLMSAIERARSGDQSIPIHFRIYDDENEATLSAYYERGTHKVKMALNRVIKENWLTWFAHEYLHFFDPILRTVEMKVDNISRIQTIAGWIQSHHTNLNESEDTLLEQYFSDLTNLSIQAEWRDWVATSIFAQKMLRTGLLQQVPPCLEFLSASGFGQRDLTVDELKQIWWKKLKEGFYVEPTGLFTDPWLKSKLLKYVNSLDETQLPILDLLELVES